MFGLRRGIKSAASSKRGAKNRAKKPPPKTDTGVDSGSDDSILIRQAHEIEKGAMLKRKNFHLEVQSNPRTALEPSIVTLVIDLICTIN